MPKWSDDIYLGSAKILMPADPALPSPITEGVGPLGRIYVFDAVPAASAGLIAAPQSPAGPGDLVLSAGAGTTVRVGSNNAAQIVLDVPRNVVVAAGSGGAPITVWGFDQYGMPMSELFAAAGAGKKAFKVVSRVSVGAAGTGIGVGTGLVIGLPFRLVDPGYMVSAYFGGTVVSAVGILPADSAPATQTTGDVRGTVPVTAPDGIKRLVMVLAMSGIQVGPNATRLGAVGVNQA